jgi:cell fate (sporulation/competence/biofilm development) regulator YmcA (YheA/YmcA/DUF963 family)
MRMAVESALAEVNQKISIAHEIESVPAIIDLRKSMDLVRDVVRQEIVTRQTA